MITKVFKRRVLFAAYLSPVVILIPRIFICSWNESLILGATILCALAAVAAIIIGVIFYQDFAGNKILDRKIDTVNNFLEEIKAMTIDITCIDIRQPNDKQITFWTRTNIVRSSVIYRRLIEFNIDPSIVPVVFEVNNYYGKLDEMSKISNSVFMPRELQSSFLPIRPHVFWEVSDGNIPQRLKVTFLGNSKPEHPKEWKIPKYVMFKDYYDALQNIISDLSDWLKKNSTNAIDLNLDDFINNNLEQ
jgi:hypothetical protein